MVNYKGLLFSGAYSSPEFSALFLGGPNTGKRQVIDHIIDNFPTFFGHFMASGPDDAHCSLIWFAPYGKVRSVFRKFYNVSIAYTLKSRCLTPWYMNLERRRQLVVIDALTGKDEAEDLEIIDWAYENLFKNFKQSERRVVIFVARSTMYKSLTKIIGTCTNLVLFNARHQKSIESQFRMSDVIKIDIMEFFQDAWNHATRFNRGYLNVEMDEKKEISDDEVVPPRGFKSLRNGLFFEYVNQEYRPRLDDSK